MGSVWDRFPQLKQIPKEKLPNHVLIIPDGNGRWAQVNGSPPIIGHTKGYLVLKEVMENLQYMPIKTVTVWGFATDNWKRSKGEIDGLMKLFEKGLKEVLPKLLKTNSRFIHLGRKDRIPKSLKAAIEKTEKLTQENDGKISCLAVDFGGQDQELRMMQKAHNLPKNIELTPEVMEKIRDGKGIIPPADLIIRTSGEQRTSDLGWLAANSEFYSIKKLLPDTSTNDFIEALIDYSKRERRFGGRPINATLNDLQIFKEKFDPYLQNYLDKKIESITANYTKDSSVLSYINYAKKFILAGGKRARPFLAYLMYQTLGGKETEKVLRLLVSLELFHAFGLMHDDIIDKGKLRHGIETSHTYITNKLKKEKRNGDLVHIGNSQAILLGDSFFTCSQEILNFNTDFNQKIMQNVKIHFYEMIDEVGIGQMIDVDIATRHKVSKELIDDKIRLKTAGYSFIKPLQIGASLAGRETNEIEKFCKEFGLRMGIAFQTQDDLLDITSNEKQLQKTTSSDKSQNQHTYFTYFKSLGVGKEIIEKNFSEAKDLVRNFSIKENAKKRFFDLIEIIQTRTF